MLVNVHKTYRWVVAICDSDLLGKKLEDRPIKPEQSSGNVMAQVDLTGDFFKGEEKEEEEVKEIVLDAQREDATFFIVGSESVELCKKLGLVLGSGVKEVGGVPVALVLL